METLYSAIKDDLLAKIKDGTYAEGEVIPTEVDLAKSYGVSRPTIRQALQILANEGYLDKRKRRGTVVTKPPQDDGIASLPTDRSKLRGVQSFEDEIRAAGRVVKTVPILVKEEEANHEVAKALELNAGALVYKLVRLRYVDDTPNVFMENYIRADFYPGLSDVDFSKVGLYHQMRSMGRPVHSLTRRLEVIKADPSSSTLLDVPIGDPLFYFHTFGRDAEGHMVEYSVSTYRGRNNTFEFSVNEPDSTAMPEPLPRD